MTLISLTLFQFGEIESDFLGFGVQDLIFEQMRSTEISLNLNWHMSLPTQQILRH